MVQVGPHRITVDQSLRGGGEDAGPGPLELLGASLGACVAFYVRRFCEARALPTDGMRVEVQARSGDMPSRVARFDVHVVLPKELPERFHSVVERVAKTCPAHNTFVHGAEVGVTVGATVEVHA
jgi:uncharacterized OsmC-like protein